MKKGIFVLSLVMSTLAYAGTTFSPPLSYNCDFQQNKCICIQNETPYLPHQVTIHSSQCVGNVPGKIYYSKAFSYEPLTCVGSGCYTGVIYEINHHFAIEIGLTASGDPLHKGNWHAGPWPHWYQCESDNPNDCPIIVAK